MQKKEKDIFYILVGCMFLEEDDDFAKTTYIKKATSMSNNVFERNLYDGFKDILKGDNFIFLSAPSFGWFPANCKKIRIKGFSNDKNFRSINYFATYLGSMFSKTKSLKKGLSKILKKINLDKYEVCFIGCELHLPYLKCAKYFKKRVPGGTTIQFVPDLPKFNNRSTNIFYKFLRKINTDTIEKLRLKYIDKYVLFSEAMSDELGLGKNKWIVNYGIAANDACRKNKPKINDGKKHIVFVGKIDKRNGVDLLLSAAKLEKEKRFVFDFYGIQASDGIPDKDFVSIENIVFHGFLKPTQVHEVLSSADVLVSPRYPNEEYTKYSFPSKIFEYLGAYKPIVTFRLDCYPKELDEILIYPKDVSVEALCESLEKAVETPDVNKEKIDNFLMKYTKKAVVNRVMELARRDL